MIGGEFSLPDVIDLVTAAAPDREMLVWTSVRRTFAEVGMRTRRLAAFLCDRGLRGRDGCGELARWQCDQPKVAVILSNCPEYIETMVGAFRARAVPFNVNHHYTPEEVAGLLARVGADAVVYHRRLAPLLRDVDLGGRVLVHVDDGTDGDPVPGSTAFEDALAAGSDTGDLPVPSPDDHYLVCTGGTTGAPKGVLWRQADIYVSAMGGVEGAGPDRITAAATAGGGVWFAASPLMHAAAQWTAFAGLTNGATALLHDDARPFDARKILGTAARERATLMAIVGDAYARPMVEELRRHPYDLSSLARLGTGGAFTSQALKHELLELLPDVTIVDGYGASETGGMAFGASRRGHETTRHALSAGAAVLSMDRSRVLDPGDDEVGWTARVGRVPMGYLDDREATEQTFPIVDGRRMAVPGDRARYGPDGTIAVLGRDAMVVNTGGEKVFVEEVEHALLRHPDVVDVLVVGRPSERFGEEVVALVEVRPGAVVHPGDIREFATGHLARFKAPRAVLVCDRVRRHPTGKADYRWARAAAADAVPAL